MKIILSIGLMLLLFGCGSNKSEKSAAETTNQYAVNFENTSFKDAQAKASKENKVLFVDFYADWCGPCKRLDKIVYKDKEAGEFINSHFVSLKIDGEKGEGPQLMKKFNIPGYPTLILFDPRGNEIDRVVGFGGDKDEYVQTLKDYLQGKNTLNDYLARLKDDPGNVELNFTLAEKYLYRDINEANKYYLKVLELDPQNKSGHREEANFQVAAYQLSAKNDARPLRKFANSSSDKRFIARAYSEAARFYRKQKDFPKLVATYEECLKRLPENASMMNSYAWDIFRLKLKDRYDRGIEVAKMAVELEPESAAIWDTLAQLQFASGNVEGAIRAMEKAVELEPETESFRELLEKYKKSRAKA